MVEDKTTRGFRLQSKQFESAIKNITSEEQYLLNTEVSFQSHCEAEQKLSLNKPLEILKII